MGALVGASRSSNICSSDTPQTGGFINQEQSQSAKKSEISSIHVVKK